MSDMNEKKSNENIDPDVQESEKNGTVKEKAVSAENSNDAQSEMRGAAFEDLQVKYTYLQADFENFRRNTAKERMVWMQTAQSRVLEGLLGVVDDFDRAYDDLQKADNLSEAEVQRFKGFELIHKGLLKLLEQHGVVEISVEGIFDPEKHEAVMQVQSDEVASGAIVEVFQKGYMHKETVLRPTKVSVAQ